MPDELREDPELRHDPRKVFLRPAAMPMTFRISLLAVISLFPVRFVMADDGFFRDKVAPIFERHCVVCHQGEKPKGGLTLATAAGFAKGSDTGPVVEPGKPDESLLVEAISGDKPVMPQKARPLSNDDVALIRQWITDGAKWPK